MGLTIEIGKAQRFKELSPFAGDVGRVAGAGEVEDFHPEADESGEAAFGHHDPAIFDVEVEDAATLECLVVEGGTGMKGVAGGRWQRLSVALNVGIARVAAALN